MTHIHSLHRPTLYEWTLLIRSLETLAASLSRPARDAGATEMGSLVGYLLNILKARRAGTPAVIGRLGSTH